jgi:type III pantothenate kinase
MSLWLLVDAGNTRVKWALASAERGVAPGAWVASGAVLRSALEQADELAAAWRGQPVVRALLCNVAGDAMRIALERQLQQAFGAALPEIAWFRSAPFAAGVNNRYLDPLQLGADRFAAAIGARALYPGEALIVATCGTATTVDALTPGADFLGGMILPGLDLMARALAAGTAQLPRVEERLREGWNLPAPFADNTVDAIASGCIAAQAGAIERAAASLAAMHGAVRCILSGGAAALIEPCLAPAPTRVDNLVLIGLFTILMERDA